MAALRARVQPARSPSASRRLARTISAKNFDFSHCPARFTEAAVGWRSSCAPTDWGAVSLRIWIAGDSSTAASNYLISALHRPACAGLKPSPKTATIAEPSIACRRTLTKQWFDTQKTLAVWQIPLNHSSRDSWLTWTASISSDLKSQRHPVPAMPALTT